MKLDFYIPMLIITMLLTSCQSATGTPISQPEQILLTQQTITQNYPEPQQDLPTPTLPQGYIRFSLDKPIIEGSTQITGTGTPGLPIIIYDITFMGEILGQGVVSSNGLYEISVIPLEAGHRIGIALSELSGSKWSKTDFQNPAFYGDEARQVPMVGFFFDTAMVSSK